jgi:hypothetical protein
MPRNFSADVTAINFRLPRKLHRQLEQTAKRKDTSMNAEALERLERSFQLDRWPRIEDFALAVMVALLQLPDGDKVAKSFFDQIGIMLGDHAGAQLMPVFKAMVVRAAKSAKPKE